MLGVLIILSAIVLIVFPSILNQVKKSQGKIDEATQLLMNSATNLYLENHKNTYGAYENDIYCISLGDLVDENYLSYPIKDSRGKELSLDSYIKVEIKARPKLNFEYVESCTEVNTTPNIPNEPDLEPGVNSQAPVIEFTGSNYIPDTATSFDAMDGVLIVDDNTPRSEIQVTITGEVALGIVGKYSIVYEAIDRDSNVATKTRVVEVIKTEYVFDYTGSYQEFEAPIDGTYKVELWGAADQTNVGKGAYTAGLLELQEKDIFYVYVGGQGDYQGSYNGGGKASGSNSGPNYVGGGGATDLRLNLGDWNNALGLRSRIMVASGGGSSYAYASSGVSAVAGGTLNGKNSSRGLTKGATQIRGGTTSSSPSSGTTAGGFGYGGTGGHGGEWGSGGGGGSGYYGGAGGSGHSGGNSQYDGGSSGSSYISGYLGCVAIASKDSNSPKSGCSDGTSDVTCSYHYSDYIFTSPVMKAGDDPTVPTHDGTSTMTGNSGDGYAKITLILE